MRAIFFTLLLCYVTSAHAFYKDRWVGYPQDDMDAIPKDDFCANQRVIPVRSKSVSIVDFGAIGDGKTLNTWAFRNAITYLSSFSDLGGGELYIPSGKWLTGSFNLTSHFTLYLDEGAILLGSQVSTMTSVFFDNFYVIAIWFLDHK